VKRDIVLMAGVAWANDVMRKVLCLLFLLGSLHAAFADSPSNCEAIMLSGAKEALPAVDYAKVLSEEAKPFVVGASGLYAAMISYGVRTKFITPDEQVAHYGPVGHPAVLGKAGIPLRFTLQVTWVLDLPDSLIDCFKLAGYNIPKRGPIKSVPVKWEDEAGTPNLTNYGTETLEPADSTTDDKGTSTLVFTPNSELNFQPSGAGQFGVSGIGKEVNVTGSLVVTPYVISGLQQKRCIICNISISNMSQLFAGIATSWNVAYHQARGFKFAEVHFQTRRWDGFTNDYTYSGYVCGASPFGNNWTIDRKVLVTTAQGQHLGFTGSQLLPMHFSQNGSETSGDLETRPAGPGIKLAFIIQPRYPPKMAVEFTPDLTGAVGGYPLTTPGIVTVPITENTNCVDVPPAPPVPSASPASPVPLQEREKY
jgi:hypothetical protein